MADQNETVSYSESTFAEDAPPTQIRQFLVFEQEEVPTGIPYTTPPKYHAVGAFNAADEYGAAMKAVKATRRVSKFAVVETTVFDFAQDDEEDEATPVRRTLGA